MGTVENHLAPRKEEFKITSKAKMKTIFFLILIVALMTADAAPQLQQLGFGQFPGATIPGLKQHGKNQLFVGAAIPAICKVNPASSICSKLAAHVVAPQQQNSWGK